MPIKKEQNTDAIKREFIIDALSTVIGKQGEEIIKFLDPEKYVNEFLIAKKLDININQTRNLLYKLSEHSLVSSTRKKDKKKGWYTYFWRLETLRILEFLKGMLKKRIDQLSNQIESREVKTFYICERCNIEYNEENALLHDFTCNECGSVFSVRDNTKVLKEFKKNIEKQQNELITVDDEIRKEKEKGDKKKVKEIQKEEKEKVKKRLEKKKERDLLKSKEIKPAKKVLKKFSKKLKSKKSKTKKISKKGKK
ncbi:MAG: hypothetical protein AABX93_00515 [Nanoarchaeota archaeon]